MVARLAGMRVIALRLTCNLFPGLAKLVSGCLSSLFLTGHENRYNWYPAQCKVLWAIETGLCDWCATQVKVKAGHETHVIKIVGPYSLPGHCKPPTPAASVS